MIAEKFLKLLVCPETHSKLTPADPRLVSQLNHALGRGELKNQAGRVLSTPIEGALVREDKQVAYPIVDNIPMLVVDEGISLVPFS
jgi:uncharacterized protein